MRPVVETKSGPVEGLIEEFNGIKGYSFRGIPYAADTSGNNRWRAPQDIEPWVENFDASSFGPQCPQFRRGEERGDLEIRLRMHTKLKYLKRNRRKNQKIV